MSDKVTVDISEDVTDVSVTEIPTSVTISDPTNTITVEETTTTVNIAPVVTTVTATEQVTTVDISENLTTVGIGDASIVASNLASTIQTSHDSGSWVTGASVQASFDNLATTADSRYVNVTGDTMTGNLNFGYGDKAVFGNESDLQMYHDGSNSYIRDAGTGNLRIDADHFYVRNLAGTQLKIGAITDGATSLYHAGNKKLETTGSGVDVTGNLSVSGQLGVGTIDTNRQLHIKGSGATVAVMVEATDGVQSSLDLKNSEGQFRIINDNGELSIYDQTDTTERFRIDTAGNVGIGISDPVHTLHVSGTQRINGQLMVGDSLDNNSIASNAALHIKNSGLGARIRIEDKDGDPNSYWDMLVDRGDSFAIYEGTHERLTFKEGGNLGIGTDNPVQKLQVVGSIYANGGNFYVDNNKGLSAVGDLVFKTNDGTNYRTAMHLDGADNYVGIGTTDPTEKLDVSGNVKATQFKGDLLGTINTATTATTQSQANNSTKVATTAYVDTAVAGLVDGAPGGLNTLNELAAALEDDVAFSTTVTNNIGTKLAKSSNLSDLTNAGTARTNLGLGTAATIDFDGEYASLNNKPTLYSDSAVNTHLNQSTANNNEVLSWTGTDYDWVPQSGGIALTDISVNGTEGTASGNGAIAYNNSSGVFQYTPPTAAGIGALTDISVTVPLRAAQAVVTGAITSVTYDNSNNRTQFITGSGGHGLSAYDGVRIGDSSGDMTEGDYSYTILHYNTFYIVGNLGIPTDPTTVSFQPLTAADPDVKITDSEGAENLLRLQGLNGVTVTRSSSQGGTIIKFEGSDDQNFKEYLEQIPGVSPSKDSFWVGGTSFSSPGGTVHYSSRIVGNTINGYASAANNNASYDISSGPTAPIYINGFGFTNPQNNVAQLMPETGNSLKIRGSTNNTFVGIEDFKFDRYNSYIEDISYRILGETPAQDQYVNLSDMRLIGLTDTTEYFTKELSDITLQIGETRWQEITMRPGPNGVRIHHNTEFENVSGETLRLHTTNRGIHVGDNTIGTYTAGDLQSNADTDFGMLAGRESTNTGSNNFGFGYKHSFGTGTASNFAAGSLHSISSAASYNNFMAGGDNKLTVAGSNNFCGGVRTDTRNSNNFTWAEGVVDGSNYYRAKNYGLNCALFGKQTEIDGNCTYSLVGGDVNDAYEHTILEGSHESILWGQHQEMKTAFSSISVGQENDIDKVTGCAVFGSSHTVGTTTTSMNGTVVGGFSNEVASSNAACFGSSNDLTSTSSRQSLVSGAGNLIEGPYNFCVGQSNNTIGESAACIGKNLKTPLFQPVVDVNGTLTEQGDHVWDNYSTVVGAYNDEAHKYHTVYPTDGTVPTDWVEDHRFVVGTGTSTGAKANGFIVSVSDADFSGIIMPALAASNSHSSGSVAKSNGVPVGGLYHTDGVVKVVLDSD